MLDPGSVPPEVARARALSSLWTFPGILLASFIIGWGAEAAQFLVSRGGGAPFPLVPTKRFYDARQMATTEAAIETAGFSQLYVSLGDQADDGSVAVRASYRPLVTLIWLTLREMRRWSPFEPK